MNESKIIEIWFDRFINATALGGELAADMHKISAAIDAAIEAGDADKAIELAGDYELAATRFGYYAGFQRASELLRT